LRRAELVLFLAFENRFEMAVAMVLIAAFLDAFDGPR